MPTRPTREIWITGVAAITSLGADVETTWAAMRAGRTAGRWVSLTDAAGHCVGVPAAPADWPGLADLSLEASAARADRLAREVVRQVMSSASLPPDRLHQAVVAMGMSKPALDANGRPPWESLMLQSGAVAAAEVLRSTGPVLSAVSACGTGLHSIIAAAQWLCEHDEPAVAVAGAVESGLNPLYAAAFLRMRVLATGRSDASRACQPFDACRDGFILGEGAGAIVLEVAEHARRRGARPVAVVAGYARGTDPAGLADMDRQGRPLAGVIRRCLVGASVRPDQVAVVKTHGTATQPNDQAECAAIGQVFGNACPPVVSFKGHLGHGLGASGAIEAALCARGMTTGVWPATANLTRPDPLCAVNHMRPGQDLFVDGRSYALCVSAGFGGHLAAILLVRP